MGFYDKGRFWEIVGKCDKVNANWIHELEQTGLPFCYIVHDQDWYTQSDADSDHQAGEIKDAHIHCLFAFSGPTTFKNAKSLMEELGFIRIQKKFSPGGAYDYLIHRYNPEKAQYSYDQIQHFNGFDIHDYSSLSDSQIAELTIDILADIEKYHIKEISQLNYLYSMTDKDKHQFVKHNLNYFYRHIYSNTKSGSTSLEFAKKIIKDYNLEVNDLFDEG